MDSAIPVGARVGTRLLATDETITPTGNFAGKSVAWNGVDTGFGFKFGFGTGAGFGTGTTRLRPRYRDGDHRSAAGDGQRA